MNQRSRKDEIIQTAAILFREKGYTGSTMRDLAHNVGIEAASLYNHINSKDELLSEICIHIAHLFTNEMNRVKKLNSSSVDKLIALIDFHILITIDHNDMIAVTNQEWRHLNDSSMTGFIKFRDQYEQNFKAIVKEGIDNGELLQADPELVMFTVLSSLRWLQFWYRPDRKLETDTIRIQLKNMLLKGIQAHG
ncbi:MAG: TetR/AcrR family transcriptional regulator [Cyclobacteriaceae bacterium]